MLIAAILDPEQRTRTSLRTRPGRRTCWQLELFGEALQIRRRGQPADSGKARKLLCLSTLQHPARCTTGYNSPDRAVAAESAANPLTQIRFCL